LSITEVQLVESYYLLNVLLIVSLLSIFDNIYSVKKADN
jgi:hypothetical protein